jgi:ribose/xylose/arabinose/galactoside ABC-type transport system permease subunit
MAIAMNDSAKAPRVAPGAGSVARSPAEWLAAWRSEIGVGTALIVLIIALSFVAQNFLSFANFGSLLTQTSVTAIVAVGMTMVIIAGEIDLSVGATVGLSGVVFAWLVVKHGMPMSAAFALVTAMSAAIGAFTGVLRVFWAIPSFITTIGLLSVLRGAAFMISEGVSIGPLPPSLGVLWYGHVLGLPLPIVLAAIAAIVAWIVLSHTRFGQYLYATGGSAETAARYGIPVWRLRVAVFVIVQLLAALGGLMLDARLNAGTATNGELFELDVIAAVIVGGTSLAGGTGRVIGTLIGVLFVAVLRNGLVLMGVDPVVFMIAQGLVIILAVWWSMLRRAAGRRELWR